MIVTETTATFPRIEWEIFELMESDPEERMEVFRAEGVDSEGNEYMGSAVYYCDEFEEIENIELS